MGGRRPQGDDAVLPLRQEERGVGLQRRRGGRRRGGDGLDLRVVGGQLEDRVAAGDDVHHLRPLVGLALERDRPVRFHRVVPRTQPHVGGAIQRRDDPPRRRACRIVADEQRMARHRRRLPLGVDQDDLDMKDAERLAGGRARADEKERREEQRAEHEVIVSPATRWMSTPRQADRNPGHDQVSLWLRNPTETRMWRAIARAGQ